MILLNRDAGRSRRALLVVSFVALGLTVYLSYRQQIFELLAAGTEWVLVTCGFVAEGEGAARDDRLRKLYYAARMFNEAPPKSLVPEDERAAAAYPGMGFGLVHTFDRRPANVVIGGWLFSIPCTYFTDARDCDRSVTTTHLKVGILDLEPMRLDNIEVFLAAASPQVLRLTLSGNQDRKPYWWREASFSGYKRHVDKVLGIPVEDMVCTDGDYSFRVMPHCVLRSMFGDDVVVEAVFAREHRIRWQEIREKTLTLVSGFQVRQ